jgi:hypothetical protein
MDGIVKKLTFFKNKFTFIFSLCGSEKKKKNDFLI